MLDHLSSLVDKSLVLAEPEIGGSTRYRFLESIREFAGALLRESGEERETLLRHLAFFRGWYPPYHPALEQAIARVRLIEHEIHNLQLAVATALQMDPPLWHDAAALLCLHSMIFAFFCHEKLYLLAEIVPHLDDGLQVPFPTVTADNDVTSDCRYSPLLAGPLKALGYYILVSHRMFFPGTLATPRAYADQALSLYRRAEYPTGIALTLALLAGLLHRQGDIAQADAFLDEACDIGRTLPHQGAWLEVLYTQGKHALMEGRNTRARTLLEQWYAAAGEFSHYTMGHRLAQLEYVDGRYARARAYCQEDITLYGNRPVQRRILGDIAREEGQLAEAVRYYALAVAQWEPAGRKQPAEVYCITLEGYAYLAIAQRKPALAARLLGCADRVREETDTPRLPFARYDYDRYWPRLCAGLPPAELDALLEEGGGMAMENALALAQREAEDEGIPA